MKRRVFIAIDLPIEQKHEVGEAIREFRWLPIRWLRPENWHVTLIPPAYLEEPEVKHLTQLLKREALGGSLTLRFSQLTLAPEGVQARMIWLEGVAPPELLRLKRKLEDLVSSDRELRGLFKRESRPLHLHVTLARFEPGALKQLESKTRILADVHFVCRVAAIQVMESHLKPSGAEYETLAVVPLQQ